MNAIRPFFYKFFRNLAACFTLRNLWWHALAIALTFVLVASGFDWWWFEHTRGDGFFALFIPAAVIGFIVPILTPLALLLLGSARQNAAYALAQSAALAWLISAFYKALTGRVHPELFGTGGTSIDLSHIFQFGFLQGGVFWGWPSSHTMVAFAIAATAVLLYPHSYKIKAAALSYALYVGISVSLTIHWFSDFAAGAILGTLVGIIVGKSFRNRPVLP